MDGTMPSDATRVENLQELFRDLAEAQCTLAEFTRGLMLKTLELADGNRTEAARRMQISVRTIYNHLRIARRKSANEERAA